MVGSTGLVSHDCGGTTLAVASAVHASKEGAPTHRIEDLVFGFDQRFRTGQFLPMSRSRVEAKVCVRRCRSAHRWPLILN